MWCLLTENNQSHFLLKAKCHQELTTNFISLLQLNKYAGFNKVRIWHTHTKLLMLHKFFGDGITPWNLWPPQTLDLTQLDFYLWGCLERECASKQHAYITRIDTQYSSVHFKHRWVAWNIRKRVSRCISEHTYHIGILILMYYF